MDKAIFSLVNYKFTNIILNLENIKNELEISFDPSGNYEENTGNYYLEFTFTAVDKKTKEEFVRIKCKALFLFDKIIKLSEIPDFFYPNTIAIIFPYMRAFVSTLTLQANIKPLVLPTMNLSALKDVLKSNTTIINNP